MQQRQTRYRLTTWIMGACESRASELAGVMHELNPTADSTQAREGHNLHMLCVLFSANLGEYYPIIVTLNHNVEHQYVWSAQRGDGQGGAQGAIADG